MSRLKSSINRFRPELPPHFPPPRLRRLASQRLRCFDLGARAYAVTSFQVALSTFQR